MSKYWCKCGRTVSKSTNAATTGNRDTESCAGCPYLLSYGPNVWDDAKKAFVRDVQGYECRMTDHPVIYGTHISSLGGPNDKTVLHIESLDFDFLDDVCAWVKETFLDGELFGSFNRGQLRTADYMDGVRVTFTPSQNKKGVATKQQLFHRFFHPDGTRIDMSHEAEKAKVLADIEKGKAAAQNKEIHMEDKVYKDAKGVLYKVGETGELGNADRTQLAILMLPVKPGATWRKKSLAPTFSIRCGKDAAQALDAMAEQNHWQLASEAEIQYNLTERTALLDDDLYGTELYSLDLSERAIRCLERAGIDTVEELAAMSDEEIMRIRDMGRKGYDEIRAALGRGETSDANPFPADDLPWSAAATAVADQTAESLEPAALTPTTETAVSASEQAENVPEAVPALDVTPTFDYSGLDEQTIVDLHLAEREYTAGKKLTEMGLRRMADGVAIAHDALCGAVVQRLDNSKHGNRGEESFRAWCSSMGMSKSTAYSLLQVSDAFMHSSPNQQKVLEQLPVTLLYDYAKPSTTEEVKQDILSGDITTHKQYQEIMARNKQLEKDAELDRKERDDANAAAMHYKAEADRRAADQQRLEGLVATRERERDTAIQDAKRARKEQEESERLADDEIARVQRIADDATDRANTAEARVKELESRPIEVTGADASDIARWRAEGVEQARQENAAQMAAMQEQLDDADAAQGNVVDALYIMVQQIAANCAAQLDNWSKAAACLTQDAYMDCVQQLDSLRIQILQMMMEGADNEEMS